MTNQEITATFEAYFEKYKKTEGDRTSWSAYWTDHRPEGVFEIIFTKCPRGDIFKPFAGKTKLEEISGWEAFLNSLDSLESENPAFDRESFFSSMKDMI